MEFQNGTGRDIRKLANQLSQVRAHRFPLAAAMDWLAVFGAAAASEFTGSVLVYVCTCAVIAARQHAFMVLTHEGVHYRIASRPWLNDLLSDLLAAYPVFFDTQIWRMTHFPHHQYLNSDKDPDWTKKSPFPEWQFPKTKPELARFAVHYIFLSGPREWMGAIRHFSGLKTAQLWNRRFAGRLIRKAIFWGSVLTTITHFHRFDLFFYYWLIPFFAFFPAIQRVRSIAEHFGLENRHELNQSRDVIGPALEAFFFGPHNVNYHLVHHLYSAVPFYNLPELHAALQTTEDFMKNAHQNSSYIWPTRQSVLADILVQPSGSGATVAKAA